MADHPAAAGDGIQKPRFTRAEKRQYAREKAVHGTQLHPKHTGPKPNRPTRKTVPSALASKLSEVEIETYIALLEAKAQVDGSKPATLAARITHNKPKKEAPQPSEKPAKELSAKKIEKIEKRSQIRAERKAAWLAKKAVENAADAPATDPVPIGANEKPPARTASKSGSPSSHLALAAAPSPARVPSRRASTVTRAAIVSAPPLPHAEDDFEDLGY
ncbi:hypothetical protein BU23DRAFT_560783 [Bimuria novae-zelandiae CBS 107.79]|uniref:Uncharacterized protein n=1 Tax=Bimuria novae-zelandiae CBS 107.79 TaxID=1447943 RepID=A0A6A5USE6_9PLEO|nr:hypothetical protein BU23DRAFT_560783 [Bimuria novae-zelandiae CBS 107.79]